MGTREPSKALTPSRRGRRKFLQQIGDKVSEFIDDVDNVVDEIVDHAKEAIIDAGGDIIEAGTELKDALLNKFNEMLHNLEPDQLLFLTLKAAEMLGDKSFLAHWRVTAVGS